MLRKILTRAFGLNAIVLAFGFAYPYYKKNHSGNPLEENRFNFQEFEKKIDEFRLKNPNLFKIKNISREQQISKLNNEKFDILVIGGGCSGAGVLLEAYEQGYKVGLIESNDFASGSSSRSTKLAHGGIRYLQDVFMPFSGGNTFEKIKLVFEALKERDFILFSCPFMNNQVEINIPFKNIFQMNYYYIGVWVYQMLYIMQTSFKEKFTLNMPFIDYSTKCVAFFEGQFFDSRQNLLSIIHCEKSAFSNYVEFKEYLYDEQGKIKGVKAYDKINNKEFEITSSVVVNCTGVKGDSNFSQNDPLSEKLVTTSKGAHIIVDKELFKQSKVNEGYMLPKTSDGRILFFLPYQRNYFIVGTTESTVNNKDIPLADNSDVQYIFKELKREFQFDDESLRKHIKSQWAGLRPLVRSPNSNLKSTKSMARNHVIRHDPSSGLISLLGGKWTTYRRMGLDVMNEIRNKKLLGEVIKKIDKNKQHKLPGTTNPINIDKKVTFEEEKLFFRNLESYVKQKYNLGEELAKNLVFKYGMNVFKILDIDREMSLNKKLILSEENPILQAELIYSIRNEMVVKPNDFLCRRSGLAFVDFNKAEKILDQVTDIISKELKWKRDFTNTMRMEAKNNLKYFV
jgi:glycerol-3-phosphate dehydrogenase